MAFEIILRKPYQTEQQYLEFEFCYTLNVRIELVHTNQDLKPIENVAQKAFSSTPDSSLDEWFSFEEMSKMIKEERGVCVIAISDDNTVLGMTYAQQESPINSKEGLEKWVIVIAAVDPNVSGKGIGSELLKEIENHARNKSAVKMFVFTNKGDENVINFYKKNGYKDAGWIQDYQYGKDNSAVFLLKYL